MNNFYAGAPRAATRDVLENKPVELITRDKGKTYAGIVQWADTVGIGIRIGIVDNFFPWTTVERVQVIG